MRDPMLGTMPRSGSLTMSSYLEQWLSHMRGRVRAKTHEGYQGLIRLYALSGIGSADAGSNTDLWSLGTRVPDWLRSLYDISSPPWSSGWVRHAPNSLVLSWRARWVRSSLSSWVIWNDLVVLDLGLPGAGTGSDLDIETFSRQNLACK
jgi:hypothetical protein